MEYFAWSSDHFEDAHPDAIDITVQPPQDDGRFEALDSENATRPISAADAWSSDHFEDAHPDAIDITVQPPQDDGRFEALDSENATRPISAAERSVDEGYLMPSTPRRRYGHRSTGVRPEELSVQHNYHVVVQRRSFDSPTHPAPHFRSHSDPMASRPQLNVQSNQLLGSAVDDGYSSPIEPSPTSSIPSSPTHSAHDPHSPILPWYTGPFLNLPQMHGQSHRGSETLSNRSSTPNLDWSVNASHMSNSLYEQFILDNSLHPPMMPGAGDFLAPGHSMMYRHSNASFWGSSDASSVRSPSPNTEWDPASPLGSSHLDDPLPDAQDEDSPKTSSSNETERAAGRQNEDLQGLTQRLQLHDHAGPTAGSYSRSGHFASHRSGTSVDIGPPHLMPSTQHPHRSTNAGSGLIDAGLSSKEQILPSGGEHSQEGCLFRPVVSTVAGRRASTARRKDKTKPGLHVCELCGADFTAKHNWRNHMNSHNSLKEFFCRMCRRGFGTKHVMQRHERKCNRRA